MAKEEKIWKTSASIIELAIALESSLEYLIELEYNWIYRFTSDQKIDELHYLNDNILSREYSRVLQFYDLNRYIDLIELLCKNDKCYVACQNIVAAKQNHNFCLICALTPEHYRKHSNHEPEIWEMASTIPRMEAAIVQATRSVESILGKPGNRDSERKKTRCKERWSEFLDSNPDDIFPLTGQSYFDYYYYLFELRNSAAHSFGDLAYNFKRSITIKAQSFSWIVLYDYMKKSLIDKKLASRKLMLNEDLIRRSELRIY